MNTENLVTKQITLTPIINKRLNDLVDKRQKEGSAISVRQHIIADLINRAHKIEVGALGE